MRAIRSGRGLGDALYLRPIAEHLAKSEPIIALTDYPDVFKGSGADTREFRRHRVDLVAHYVEGKSNLDTNVWQDVCAAAGFSVPMQFKWRVLNTELVKGVLAKANGKPIVLVHGGHEPMNRTDGFGLEMVPSQSAFDAALHVLRPCCYLVNIGKVCQLYPLQCDLDLHGKTSVTDLLDLAQICSGIVAQCSFAIPLAECFDKPLLAVWAARGLESKQSFIRTVTPAKMLTKKKSIFVIDDWPDYEIGTWALNFWESL